MVLAGVLGGILVLATLGLGAFALIDRSEDGQGGETSSSTSETTAPEIERIGTSVLAGDLLAGDCVDYQRTRSDLGTFDIVSCDVPHVAEVTGLVTPDEVGQGFPGTDTLRTVGHEQCGPISDQHLGVDSYQTSLEAYFLTPDFSAWEEGVQQVLCLVAAYDGTTITGSAELTGEQFVRPRDVPVLRLAIGDCFDSSTSSDIFALAVVDNVTWTGCGENHRGLLFGRGQLPEFGVDSPYPGVDAVDDAATDLCRTRFSEYFGVESDGFAYRFWVPTDETWGGGDRFVYCAILDQDGLPTTLDYATYRPLFEQPIGTCYLLPPEETADSLNLDDQVGEVPCEEEHHGQLFGTGELAAGDYPGKDAANDQGAESCTAHFVDFVGTEPSNSIHGDFIYWYPSETGWAEGDLRYACSVLDDTTVSGSAESTG